MTAKLRAAEVTSVHNGLIGDQAKGYLDGFRGIPARTDVAHQDAYDTGWLEGAADRDEEQDARPDLYEVSEAAREELAIELDSTGDPRRCPRHPQVQTSSPDGLHDAPCGQCELEHDAASFDELAEAPELGDAFFEDPILVRPGESLIERLDEERHDAFVNDLKPRG